MKPKTVIRMKPNAKLIKLAKKYPPPDSWFDADENKIRPVTPKKRKVKR